MSTMIASSLPRLSDLEAPMLDFSDNTAPETVLDRLRVQNGALASLREALVCEEARSRRELCVLG